MKGKIVEQFKSNVAKRLSKYEARPELIEKNKKLFSCLNVLAGLDFSGVSESVVIENERNLTSEMYVAKMNSGSLGMLLMCVFGMNRSQCDVIFDEAGL